MSNFAKELDINFALGLKNIKVYETTPKNRHIAAGVTLPASITSKRLRGTFNEVARKRPDRLNLIEASCVSLCLRTSRL